MSRKKLALFLGAALLLSAAGICRTQELKVRVVSKRTNVWEKPSLKNDVADSVKRWMHLQADGKEVSTSTLQFQEKKTSVSDHKYGAGLRLSGNFYYKIAERLSLELSIQTYRVNIKEDALELAEGKLLMVPIQLSLHGNFPLKNNFSLYLICGLGYYLNNYSPAVTIPEWGEKVNNSSGVHFGGGVDYFFNKNIALNADLRFCRVETSVSLIYLGEIIDTMGDVNLSSFILGIGVKYFF